MENNTLYKNPEQAELKNEKSFTSGYSSQGGTIMLKEFIKEIKKENLKIILLNIFTWLGFLTFLTLTTLAILEKRDIFSLNFLKSINGISQWLFLFVILVPGLVLFLILTIYSQLTKYRFDQEKKFHFQYKDEIDLKRVPDFVINKYKRINGSIIIINWFAFVSYLICALMLAFFLFFQNKVKLTIADVEINLKDGRVFPDYEKDIMGTAIYLGCVFLLQIIVIILAARSKGRIMALFDLRNRINFEEIQYYKKKVHIVCFCVFLLPFFLVFFLIWLIKKFRKKTT